MTRWKASTPLMLQMQAIECGAASLGIILGYWGKFLSLTELCHECAVTRDGCNALDIIKAASALEMDAHGQYMDLAQLQNQKKPAILLWKEKHFIVLEGISKTKVFINDPAVGHIAYTREEFAKGYSSIAITLTPKPNFQKSQTKPTDLLQKLIKDYLPHFSLLFIFLNGLFFFLTSFFFPMILRIFIDNGQISNVNGWKWESFAFFTSAITLGFLFLASYQMFIQQLGNKIALSASCNLLLKLLRLPLAFYQQRNPGEMSRRVEVNQQIIHTLILELTPAAVKVLFSLFFAILMFTYDFWLTVITLIGALSCLLAMKIIYHVLTPERTSQGIEEELMNITSLNDLSAIEEIKIAGSESYFFTVWASLYTRFINGEQRTGKRYLWLKIFPFFTLTFCSALLLITGSEQIVSGKLSLGMLAALQLYLLLLLSPIHTFIQLLDKIASVRKNLKFIDDINYTPIEISHSTITSPHFLGEVEFQNVTFHYYPSRPPEITNVSFHCHAGQWLGISGPTKSGKSTIGKLTAALLHPHQGRILYDGKTLQELTGRPPIFWSNQESYLFEGSYRDNITFWNPHISEEQLLLACQQSGLDTFIAQKPKKLHAWIAEKGKNLSATEKQLVEITRIFLLNPRLVIFDETLTILLPEIKKNILQRLRAKKCSGIFISQDSMILEMCDKVFSWNHGHFTSI